MADEEQMNPNMGIGLFERYARKFGSMPSTALWEGPGLDVLMEAAIKRGRALTDEELLKAQGVEPPPPRALY